MPSSEEILEQIDAAVTDWTVSGDAMRCRPTPEPDPIPAVPVVSYTGREAARALLVRRLIDNHGLTRFTARRAVAAAEQGRTTRHTDLVSAEARAATAEAAEHIGRAIAAFARALQPVAQAAAATLRQLDDALRAAGHRCLGGKPGRPAWQSPYGPPPRRKR
ncbi:hypothetical protein SEA_KROMP_61 [Streptomyces phage Kromp]|uniref:Uncharacterized protein n=1 Tax=Streptomyces phage Kromp TaxID=2315619 RepID=A0A386KA60_9CAUD|nr:hypothetical protein SEA_KROMP_61 [Streptomyces phage Kromp]